MKMGFLLKNNARKRMGEKGVLKKGEEKECRKKASKIREFKNGWPVGRKFANFEGWGNSV